jgi:hypothetical protein
VRPVTILDWATGILLAATAVILLTNEQYVVALLVGVCAGFCLGITFDRAVRR